MQKKTGINAHTLEYLLRRMCDSDVLFYHFSKWSHPIFVIMNSNCYSQFCNDKFYFFICLHSLFLACLTYSYAVFSIAFSHYGDLLRSLWNIHLPLSRRMLQKWNDLFLRTLPTCLATFASSLVWCYLFMCICCCWYLKLLSCPLLAAQCHSETSAGCPAHDPGMYRLGW